MNIVDKHNGRVRSGTISDGSKEWRQPRYKKEDGASPTVVMDSIMITATISTHKHQDVARVDIPGAFLHAYNNKDTFMLLRGCLPNSWSRLTLPSAENKSSMEKNNKALLYVELSKAIYSLLKSALLFYKKFVDNLKNYEPLSSSTPMARALLMSPLLDFR
jgi:hypothetical protein